MFITGQMRYAVEHWSSCSAPSKFLLKPLLWDQIALWLWALDTFKYLHTLIHHARISFSYAPESINYQSKSGVNQVKKLSKYLRHISKILSSLYCLYGNTFVNFFSWRYCIVIVSMYSYLWPRLTMAFLFEPDHVRTCMCTVCIMLSMHSTELKGHLTFTPSCL